MSGHYPVPICAQATNRCQYLPGHLSEVHVQVLVVPICNWASLRCPNVLGHLSGVLMCPGTLPLPICARATLEFTFRFPCLLVHPSGTHIRCSYVLGQNSGAHICTSLISIPMCAPAPFQCLYLSGHHFGAHMPSTPLQCTYVPSTFLFPICDEAPFQCQYVPGHPSGDHMCPGTLPMIMCPYVPRSESWGT